MGRVMKQADEAISRCEMPKLKKLKTNLTGKTNLLLQRKAQEVNAALQRCNKPKPVVARKKQRTPAEQARHTCRLSLGEGGIAVSRGNGRFDCSCRQGFLINQKNSGCVSKQAAISAGRRYCASTIPGSKLESVKSMGEYKCVCPSSLYYNHIDKACIDWDGVVAHGKGLCARKGQVLGHINAFNKYLCCGSDTPYYDKSDNKCHSKSAGARAASRDREAEKTRKRQQREDAQKVIEGLTEIIGTIQSSKSKRRKSVPNWPGTTGGGGSGGGGSSSSARCQNLSREAERHSSRMQATMSRYRGQKDVACEISRLGKQQQELIRRMKQAGCSGASSIPNMRYPSFPGCN